MIFRGSGRWVVSLALMLTVAVLTRSLQHPVRAANAPPMFAAFIVDSLLDTSDAVPGNGACATAGAVCTLRAAIEEANALAGADTITFSVAGTITTATELPPITAQVTITGTVAGVSNQPTILLNSGGQQWGLWFSSIAGSSSSNSSVYGLAINAATEGANGAGIRIEPGVGGDPVSGVTVTGCWLGMNAAGTAATSNDFGVRIVTSTNNIIGGSTVLNRNVICGNSATGVVALTGSNGNQVIGNWIGLRPDGTAAIANSVGGVVINASTGVFIGGTVAGQGNVISGNTLDGIMVTGAVSANSIIGNIIGLDDDGTTDRGNIRSGILVTSSQGTSIVSNVISGNGLDGISLGEDATQTVITGNTIGLNSAGTADVSNTDDGITVGDTAAAGNGADNNTIGGTTPAERNVISGHNTGADSGIVIRQGSSGNQVLGNYIGTDVTGALAIPNTVGISITNNATVNNIIGSATGRNVISGNTTTGITLNSIAAPGNNQIVGNYIGLAADGIADLGNGGDGVSIGAPSAVQNIVGPGNVISGNDLNGVQLGNNGDSNQVIGNIIGLNAAGTAAVGNTLTGVAIGSAGGQADANTIGGTTTAARNIISGNGENGISLRQASDNNQILGNYIGTNAAGTLALGNGANGIMFLNLGLIGNSIGSTTAGSGNVISGNLGDGIHVAAAANVTSDIKRNLIGLAAGATNAATSGIPNLGHGINILSTQAGTEITIGRSDTGASPSSDGNLIAFNALNGVSTGATGNIRVFVSENQIFLNGGLGVDIGAPGVTPNDVDTVALTGPNGGQNFPVITSALTGSITLTGTLTSVASTTFTIEFYSSDTCDATSNGEGRTFVGSTSVTTSAGGVANFNVTFATTPAPNDVITAVASRVVTGLDVTSEFSQCRIVRLATAVEFAGFAARSYERGVELEWSTGFEASNLGFNIYRDRAGERERLNPSLISGSALMIGAGAKLLSGNSYSWWDAGLDAAGSTYWVESIDLDGTSEWHGPYGVQPGDGREPRRTGPVRRAVMLSEVNNLIEAADGSHAVEPHADLPALDSSFRSAQQDLAARPAVKIGVEHAGWYRLTQAQLVSAGLAAGVNPRMLQLFVDGQQVPISVSGEQDGRLDAGDTVEFYGMGLDIASTAQRTYWLVEGSQLGKRIPTTSLSGGATPPSSYPQTVERDERGVYFSNLLNGEAENFFGAVVRNASTDQSLTLTHVDTASSGQAELEVALQGITVQLHRVRVSLNGSALTMLEFFGKVRGTAKVQVAQNLVREGSNTVTLEGEMGSGDLSLVDHVRLTYARNYFADSNRAFVTAPGGTKLKIGGFSSNDIRVFDVGDPKAVVELVGTITGGNGDFGVEIATAGGSAKKLLAVTSSSMQTAASVKPNTASRLSTFAGRGNLYVVAHSSLMEALKPLIDQRKQDGWKVIVADIEDVYDEYSFGHKTPEALREWLRAMEKKSRTMSYLLLAGDGSFDPRDYLGFGSGDLVPAKSIDTSVAETVSDDWFGDFDGDGLSEMAVGRLPVRTAAEATALVGKVLAYEKGSSGQGVTLISDFNDTYDFLGTSNRVKGVIPPSTSVDMIISGQTADVRARLLESLNKGPKLVNYAGHGSVDLWRGNVFTSADAVLLKSSGRVSVFLIMTCLNGYYHAPNLDSLAESLLKAPGGAAAVWASSGFTVPTDQEELDAVMVRTLYGTSGITLGRAIRAAKAAIGDPDVRRTWILLGDPTMVYNK